MPHLRITWDDKKRRASTSRTMVKKLREGEPSIEVRPGSREDALDIGVWMMEPGEDAIVGRRLHEVLQG